MKLIRRGAEGDIYSMDWHGCPSILKTRRTKAYRHPDLDQRIRRHRTVHESQIISHVKSFGVPAPLVYFVDVKRCEIIMQHIPGTPVHDLPPGKIISCSKSVGAIVGLLHKNGVMHGDPTTSNFILSEDGVHVVDFGLAVKTEKPEDHAVDLRLVKETLNSAHAEIMDGAWRDLLAGYRPVVGAAYCDKILKLVSIIEGRGRYAAVV